MLNVLRNAWDIVSTIKNTIFMRFKTAHAVFSLEMHPFFKKKFNLLVLLFYLRSSSHVNYTEYGALSHDHPALVRINHPFLFNTRVFCNKLYPTLPYHLASMLQGGNQYIYIYLSSSECGPCKRRVMSHCPLYPQSLAKCLAHKNCSVHAGLMSE